MKFGGQPSKCAPHRTTSTALPKVKKGQPKNDLATPSTADSTTLWRLQGRKKLRSSGKVKVLLSKAMRFKLQQVMPKGLACQDRRIWKKVHLVSERPVDLSKVICGLCWTQDVHFCSCGAEVAETYNEEQLHSFVEFVSATKNPLKHAWDPEDQRELLQVLRCVCTQKMTAEGLFAIYCLAGLVGKADSVEALGECAARGCEESLRDAIFALHKERGAVFRGGQRPGMSLRRIAGAVHGLLKQLFHPPCSS